MTSRTIAVLFMNGVNKISLELKAVTKTPYKIIAKKRSPNSDCLLLKHPVEGRRHKQHKLNSLIRLVGLTRLSLSATLSSLKLHFHSSQPDTSG